MKRNIVIFQIVNDERDKWIKGKREMESTIISVNMTIFTFDNTIIFITIRKLTKIQLPRYMQLK